MREGNLRKTLSAVMASASSSKPSSTPSGFIRSNSVPSTKLSDTSNTTIDMLSLQALHYQSMGLDLNLESSLDREEQRKTSDIRYGSEGLINDTSVTHLAPRSGTPSPICHDPGRQESSDENETLQGVLSIIASAVYPHCGHDTSSISSRSIASEQDVSEQEDKATKSDIQDKECSSAIYDASEGAAPILTQPGPTPCTMPHDAISNSSDHNQKKVETYTTGNEAEKESMSMVVCDVVQLDSLSLLSHHSDKHSRRMQVQGALESQTTAQGPHQSPPPPFQSSASLATSLTRISGTQAKELVEGKQEQTSVPDDRNVESQERVASLQQDTKQSGGSETQEVEIQGASLLIADPTCGHASRSETFIEETIPVHSLTEKLSPTDDGQTLIAQETSKPLLHDITRSENFQPEKTLVQPSDIEMALTQTRADASVAASSITLGAEVALSMLPSDKLRKVSSAKDRFRDDDKIQARLLKRSFTNIDASEASRQKPHMDTLDQQSLDHAFRYSKGRGSPPSTSRPLSTITSSSSALENAQSQRGSKRRKHVNGVVSSRKSQPPDLQDAQRKSRKTFSMPVLEYALFYASPTGKPTTDTRLETSDAKDVNSAVLNPEECDHREMPFIFAEHATGGMANENVSSVSSASLGPSDVKRATKVPVKAARGLSRDAVALSVGARNVVNVAFAHTYTSTSLPCQEYSGTSLQQGCSQPLAVPGVDTKEGSPGEKDWNQASVVSQQSQTDNFMDHDETPEPQDEEDVVVAKKPLVVFTQKFRRPLKNIVHHSKAAALLKPETRSVTTSTETATPCRPSTEPYPAGRQARALEKLKRPFKSPLKNDETLLPQISPRAPSTMDNAGSSHSSGAACAFSPENQRLRLDPDNVSQNQTGPEHLHSERIVTKRLASSFAAPFSSPLKGSEFPSHASALSTINPSAIKSFSKPYGRPKEDRSNSGLSLTGEIAALERRKQILKQAIKIKRDPQEEHLQELVTQWKQAGRDIVELLYPIVPRPEPQAYNESITTPSWDAAPIATSGNEIQEGQFLRGGGEGGDAEMTVEVQESRDWNYGTMILSLQVDPQLLGWDEAAEDWKSQC
ncbi:hypothetical protein QFC21_001368 [Naganishia friedmannii]|uniref:Uncharacterized protein n=1 Tax=Naganishia friedmannii TaxID=89922 RepID=A0ACC2W3B3_9TREE|nr:hypothetical protein QFC21_001368 [Naganishia friedmannii]